MSESVERSTLDLRYEGHRMRDDAAEARLRASIAERGIQEPLEGVDTRKSISCSTALNASAAPKSWVSNACPTSRWARKKRWESSL